MKRLLVYGVSILTFVVLTYLGFILVMQPCESYPLKVPMQIISNHFFYVDTNQGPLYVGQTYRYRNEGPWVGNYTLLFSTPKKALFLIEYPTDYPENSKSSMCRYTYQTTGL